MVQQVQQPQHGQTASGTRTERRPLLKEILHIHPKTFWSKSKPVYQYKNAQVKQLAL